MGDLIPETYNTSLSPNVLEKYINSLSQATSLPQIFKSNSFKSTVIANVPRELYSIMQYYYEYLLVEGEFGIPKKTPFKINYFMYNSSTGIKDNINVLLEHIIDALPTKQIAMLRFEITGTLKIKPFKINLWVEIGENPYLMKQEFPIKKDGWGLITNDRNWTSKSFREIGIFKIFKDVSILIELQDIIRGIWAFSELPIEKHRK